MSFANRCATYWCWHYPRGNRALGLGGPPWSGDGPGGQRGQAQGNGPGRVRRARFQGVSGPAARRGGWGWPRKTNQPRLFPTPCASIGQYLRLFLDQAQPRFLSAGNGARFFQGMHPKSPKVQNRGGDLLKTAQATGVSFLMQLCVKYGKYF